MLIGLLGAGEGYLTCCAGCAILFRIKISQAFTQGEERGLGAVGEVQFAQNALHMHGDGPLTDDEFLGNLAIGEATGYE